MVIIFIVLWKLVNKAFQQFTIELVIMQLILVTYYDFIQTNWVRCRQASSTRFVIKPFVLLCFYWNVVRINAIMWNSRICHGFMSDVYRLNFLLCRIFRWKTEMVWATSSISFNYQWFRRSNAFDLHVSVLFNFIHFSIVVSYFSSIDVAPHFIFGLKPPSLNFSKYYFQSP